MAYKNPVLTADLMRSCDAYTINSLGVPSQALMESAARGVVSYLVGHPELFPVEKSSSSVALLCGSGNNGGDGLAAARFLSELGYQVSVCYTGRLCPDGTPDTTRMSEECARQYHLLSAALVPVFAPVHMSHVLAHTDVVIDAMLGIGLDREVAGVAATLIEAVNKTKLPVLSVDIPSGIHADTGEVMGCAVRATATVTMQAIKAGLLRFPGAEYCGEISICDIGVDLTPAEGCDMRLCDDGLLSLVMPPRARRSHKGTYGQLALVTGSEGMCGAAVLAAEGAMRSGAGLVRVVTPVCNRTVIQTAVPETIVTCYDSDSPLDGRLIEKISACDGAVIGCGLGASHTAVTLMGGLLDTLPVASDYPVVLDADALNILAKHPHLWRTRLLTEGRAQVVITPHPAEMARLADVTVAQVLENPVETAQAFAKAHGLTVVLKDAHTVVASPGGEVYICAAGNAGMAKGGSGDVLAGIIGSLLTQRRGALGNTLSSAAVAAAGVYLHARAGDTAAEAVGEYAMTPTDLICQISVVTKALSNTRTGIGRFLAP